MSTYRVAALLTCYNRKAKTTACLQALFDSAEADRTVEMQAFLTDDGSTDGTAEAVRSSGWPVRIADGDGSLFWTRGMVRAWELAEQSDYDFDAYLLLNDDTLLDIGAISALVGLSRQEGTGAIIVAAIRDPDSGEVTYGGVVQAVAWHPAKVARLPESDELQVADTFNANCVLIPRRVFEAIGMLDERFVHSMGDFDYGLRATRAGFRVLVAPRTQGVCSRNSVLGTWEDASLPLAQRLELLNSPKGLPHRAWRTYLKRHGPWFWALLALGPTVKVVLTWLSRSLPSKRRTRSVSDEDGRLTSSGGL